MRGRRGLHWVRWRGGLAQERGGKDRLLGSADRRKGSVQMLGGCWLNVTGVRERLMWESRRRGEGEMTRHESKRIQLYTHLAEVRLTRPSGEN